MLVITTPDYRVPKEIMAADLGPGPFQRDAFFAFLEPLTPARRCARRICELLDIQGDRQWLYRVVATIEEEFDKEKGKVR